MILRILFLTLFLSNLSFASFQKVRIGKIDNHYKHKITKHKLRKIIKEIEHLFESKLKKNIFNYSSTGKDIDIIYLPPSNLEKKIRSKISKLEIKKKEIDNLSKSFSKNLKKINKLKERYKRQNNLYNRKLRIFNDKIDKINKKKNYTNDEYQRIKTFEKSEKEKFSREVEILNKNRRSLKKDINKYKQKITKFNDLIQKYNMEKNKLVGMLRNYKNIKGRTFGFQKVELKTYHEAGKKVKVQKLTTNMNKIEIYGFSNLRELKAVLAHEIAHLVGIPHINVKNALMNPILQKNQLKKVSLTREDIKAFKEYF